LGTARDEAAASTGLGRSGFGVVVVVACVGVALETAGVAGALTGAGGGL
jgi:hypothetical protein